MLSGLDLLVALLSAPGPTGMQREEIRGITRLEKMMFLLLMEGGFEERVETKYDYQPYDFGPYSSVVIKELETLKTARLVSVREVPLTTFKEIIDMEVDAHSSGRPHVEDKVMEIYSLTDRGLKVWSDVVKGKMSEVELERVQAIKERFNGMDLESLIRYVHEKHPEYTQISTTLEDMFGLGSRPSLTPFVRD